MKYIEKVESDDSTWNVYILDTSTNRHTWTKVSKLEYPTKREALDYLIERYEDETGMTMKDISIRNYKQMPTRMMADYVDEDRKKKSTKPKSKRKSKKKRKV